MQEIVSDLNEINEHKSKFRVIHGKSPDFTKQNNTL